MDVSQEVLDLGVRLTEAATRRTASNIADRIGAVRANRNADERVAELEEIIQGLIDDKNELVSVAQAYKAEVASQRLTAGDVQYIANTVVPLIEQLAQASSGQEKAKALAMIEKVKPLLSVDTVNILQLIGFNFRRGIGEPLTQKVSDAITGPTDRTSELQIENLRNQRAMAELAQDPEAYERFLALYRTN